MTRPLYRIYLTPDRFGRFQQTPRRTRDFYDIDLNQFKAAPQTRWYRIVQSSPGRVFSTLWKAGDPETVNQATISELGAFMRVFSDLWYVDSRDVDLERAADLNQSPLTKPRILALSLAALTLIYLAAANLIALWGGQAPAIIQPLARFAGLAMLILLAAEQVLNGLKRWRQSQENW